MLVLENKSAGPHVDAEGAQGRGDREEGRLICGGLLDVVDDDYFYGTFGGDELEAELLLDGGEHGWVGLNDSSYLHSTSLVLFRAPNLKIEMSASTLGLIL